LSQHTFIVNETAVGLHIVVSSNSNFVIRKNAHGVLNNSSVNCSITQSFLQPIDKQRRLGSGRVDQSFHSCA